MQTVTLNLGKSDYCQIWAEHDRCTDGAELWWLVVGGRWAVAVQWDGEKSAGTSCQPPASPGPNSWDSPAPGRLCCEAWTPAKHRPDAGWAGRPWIGLVRFQISADEKGESWTQRHNHKEMLSWRERERERERIKNKGSHNAERM